MGDRATEHAGRDGERIPLSRVAPGGPGSTDALGWCARGAGVVLLLAAMWLVFAGVRPLAPVTVAEPASVRAARVTLPPALSVSERTALLNAVTRSNWFSPERQMWSIEDQQAALAQAQKGTDQDARKGGATEVTPDEDPPGSIRVTKKEDLPDRLAKAFGNLELRGIRSTSDGGMLAMITFIQGKTRPATTPFAAGESFTDESFPGEAWKIVLIDATLDRVFLRREGNTVVLPLFSGSAAVVADVDGQPAPEPDPGAVGVSRDEVVAQLRAAGISDAEITELLRLADADLAPPAKASAAEESIEKTADALAEREDASGMAGVLEMMKNAKPTVRPVETAANERADTFDSPGRGHSIASVDALAGVVTLADGSRWAVDVSEAEKVASWPADAPISVYPGRRVGRAYVIVNELTRSFAPASHIVGSEVPLQSE